MIRSSFNLENKLISEGYDLVIGIDEAGRGPLAGPVIASAVALRNFQFPISNFHSNSNDRILKFNKQMDLIRDSKTLSARQREEIFDFIHDHFYVGIGICSHETIDRMNIMQASFLAMKKAVTDLLHKLDFQISNFKFIILLDGNKLIPNFSYEQKAVVNGDKIVKSISAASIIAKVTRDRIMMEMHKKYPVYNFAQHKGYGTQKHIEALYQYGPCEIHRQSFIPIKKLQKIKYTNNTPKFNKKKYKGITIYYICKILPDY